MHSAVIEAQTEARQLRDRMAEVQRCSESRERQLRIDASTRISMIEEKHAIIRKKLMAKSNALQAQVLELTEENTSLRRGQQQKDRRIQQLEQAISGKALVFG